jgi:nucleoside-diphosphate kinase
MRCPNLLLGLQEKPSAGKYEALAFISRWLMENNPNKPKIITPDDFALEEEEDDEAEFAGVS